MNTPLPRPGDAWFVRPRPHPYAPVRLFCFSHAGGAASAYYGWGAALDMVEVLAVQLPGREGRMREAPITDSRVLIAQLADAIEPWLDRPFVFFGHSMGALIAYELTLELRRRNLRMPATVFVSGRRSPSVEELGNFMHKLNDRDLVLELNRRFSGLPAAITDDAELLALFLPVIRADITLLETHAGRAELPLDVPLSAFGGIDDAGTSTALLAAWQDLVTPPLRVCHFEGGHFYLHQHRAAFLRDFHADLTALLATILLAHDHSG